MHGGPAAVSQAAACRTFCKIQEVEWAAIGLYRRFCQNKGPAQLTSFPKLLILELCYL